MRRPGLGIKELPRFGNHLLFGQAIGATHGHHLALQPSVVVDASVQLMLGLTRSQNQDLVDRPEALDDLFVIGPYARSD